MSWQGEKPMFDDMSRRSFVKALAVTAAAGSAAKTAFGEDMAATAGMATEWSYVSGKQYSDPFNQVELDAIVTTLAGKEERVPAFWAGGSTWKVRYAPQAPGAYKVKSACSDAANHDLHGKTFT